MISLAFMIGVLGLLFIMAYVTNRRFGILGLGLTAGSLLSTHLSGLLTPFLEDQGLSMVAPPLALVVAAALVLAPAVLLLFGGPSYTLAWQQVLGSVAFAVLGFAFLFDPLTLALQLDGAGVVAATFLRDYIEIIIVVGVIAALVDVLLAGN